MADTRKRKNQGLNGLNPLSYLGQNTVYAPDTNIYDRDPTINDAGLAINDLWTNTLTEQAFILVKREIGNNVWLPISGAGVAELSTLKDTVGTAVFPAVDGSISIKGGELIDVTASANTLTVDMQRGLLNGQIPITAMGGATQYASISPGANIVVTPGPNSLTISAAGGGAGDLTAVANVDTATSVAGSMNILGAAPIVTTGNLGTTLTISSNGTLATTYATGTGNAIPAAGVLTVAGTVNKIVTTGAGSTVTLTTGTSVPTSFPSDAGTATPAAGVLTVHGGQNIGTTAAGSTVTVNLDNTYQVAVAPASLEIGTVDNTQKLGSISIAALKVLLGLP